MHSNFSPDQMIVPLECFFTNLKYLLMDKFVAKYTGWPRKKKKTWVDNESSST